MCPFQKNQSRDNSASQHCEDLFNIFMWIKDSDFNPSCSICREPFETDPSKKCVFLDVYHWDCLNNYVLSLPPTTTPAGYLCPLCDQPIIPQANHGGPVAEALRTCLSEVDWAKGSLNEIRKYFPIEANPRVNSTPNMYMPTQSTMDVKLFDPRLDLAAKQFLKGRDVTDILETPLKTSGMQMDSISNGTNIYSDDSKINYQRRDQFLSSNPFTSSENDDNAKYKHHLSVACFKRFLRGNSSKLLRVSSVRRHRLIILIVACIILIFLLGFYGSQPNDISGDPLLDPHMNPNLHFKLEPIDSMKVMLDNNHNNGGDRRIIGGLNEA
ncbi:unnamed protein product [Trichobilharzia szidati]|nr:unnamed protein product [Trichobilharzia szidati]